MSSSSSGVSKNCSTNAHLVERDPWLLFYLTSLVAIFWYFCLRKKGPSALQPACHHSAPRLFSLELLKYPCSWSLWLLYWNPSSQSSLSCQKEPSQMRTIPITPWSKSMSWLLSLGIEFQIVTNGPSPAIPRIISSSCFPGDFVGCPLA